VAIRACLSRQPLPTARSNEDGGFVLRFTRDQRDALREADAHQTGLDFRSPTALPLGRFQATLMFGNRSASTAVQVTNLEGPPETLVLHPPPGGIGK
jgi:hypothetical protein